MELDHSKFEEGLRNLRRTHFGLITLTATLFFFGITSNNLDTYIEARDELRTLIEFIDDQSKYDNLILAIRDLPEKEQYYFRYLTRPQIELDIDSMSLRPRRILGRVDFQTESGLIPIFTPDTILNQMTLEIIKSNLNSKAPVIGAFPEFNRKSQFDYRNFAYKIGSTNEDISSISLGKFKNMGGRLARYYFTFDKMSHIYMNTDPNEIQVAIHKQNRNFLDTTQYLLFANLKVKLEGATKEETLDYNVLDFDVRFIELPLNFYKSVLNKDTGVLLGSDDTWLPNLSKHWSILRYKTPSDGYQWLAEKVENSRGSISVFGLTISQEVILFGGPLLTFFILLYFLAHLEMLLRVNLMSSIYFPWTVVFENSISRILTAVSIILFPPLSNFLILYNNLDLIIHSKSIQFIVTAIVLVVLLIICYWNYRLCEELRNKMGIRKKPLTNDKLNEQTAL